MIYLLLKFFQCGFEVGSVIFFWSVKFSIDFKGYKYIRFSTILFGKGVGIGFEVSKDFRRYDLRWYTIKNDSKKHFYFGYDIDGFPKYPFEISNKKTKPFLFLKM